MDPELARLMFAQHEGIMIIERYGLIPRDKSYYLGNKIVVGDAYRFIFAMRGDDFDRALQECVQLAKQRIESEINKIFTYGNQ